MSTSEIVRCSLSGRGLIGLIGFVFAVHFRPIRGAFLDQLFTRVIKDGFLDKSAPAKRQRERISKLSGM